MGTFKFTLTVSALTLVVPVVSAYYGSYGGFYNGFSNVLGNGSPSFGGRYGQLGQKSIAYEAPGFSGFGQRNYDLSGIDRSGHSLSGFNDNLRNIITNTSPGIGSKYGQNGLVYGTAAGLSGFGQKHYGLSGFGQSGHNLSGFGQGGHRLSGIGRPFEQDDFIQYYRNGFRR